MEKTNKKGFLAWFTDNWKRKPLFSTGIALLVMVILQILALGFDYASFGEWFAAFSRNWINILRNNAGVGIIALGMTFVIISGGIDLAVGSTMVAIGAVVMSLIDGGPAGLLAGLGITGIPAYIIAIAIGILLGLVLGECTGFGRQVFAIGSNERTSKLSGVNVRAVKRRVYALMGALVAVTAVIQIARIGSMDYANAGSGYEMDAIAAVIIGGTSMSGGRGSVIGSVLGMLILAVMNNLLNLIGVPPFLREAFKGIIVIGAVLLQKKEKAS